MDCIKSTLVQMDPLYIVNNGEIVSFKALHYMTSGIVSKRRNFGSQWNALQLLLQIVQMNGDQYSMK
jgi:hypothetical protein